MLLVANKVDLVHLRKVTEESGRELALKLGIPYIETSAKDPPVNVDAAFHEVPHPVWWPLRKLQNIFSSWCYCQIQASYFQILGFCVFICIFV
jgi:hypothetical protein